MSLLTYLATHNHNPKSAGYTLKLRGNSEGKLIIGIDYRCFTKSQQQVFQDFSDIGFMREDAETLSNYRNSSGNQAKKLMIEYANVFILKPHQERKLFEIDA